MSLLVVDASVIASWLLPSQATAATERLLRQLGQQELIAPAVLPIEVRALLLKAERRGWVPRTALRALLEAVDAFDIELYPMPDIAGFDEIFEQALRLRLGFYDALYLDLALEEGAALATRDASLVAAAVSRGLAVHDLRPATGVHED
jgi:predicted nucleic acid-binding protein